MALVKQGISEILRRVIPDISGRDIATFITHIMGDTVGVQTMKDLGDLTSEMFPPSFPMSMIKKKQLLAAFENASGDQDRRQCLGPRTSHEPQASGSAEAQQPSVPQRSEPAGIWERRSASFDYSFTVPWNDLPKETLRDRLQSYKDKGKKAPEKLITLLKLEIARKLVANWLSYRENHPEITQKNPGRVIYRSIARQVCYKYGIATDIVINDMFVANGQNDFVEKLEECVENMIAKKLPCTTPKKIIRAQGTVGVILDQYNPGVSEERKGALESVRDHLKMIHGGDPSMYDWESILQDMQDTFYLQREDIVAAKGRIEDAADEQEVRRRRQGAGAGAAEVEDVGDVDEEGLQVRELAQMQKKWPFLFSYKGINQHATKLTGRNLEARFTKFVQDHFDYLQMHLITGSRCNIKNLVVRHIAEKSLGGLVSTGMKFLAALEMLCNHFEEDFDSLVLTCERTTDIDVLGFTLLEDGDGSPCIVAFDHDKFAAEKFAVCADKTPLLTVSDPAEALMALVNVCFVFDLSYPSQHKVFEFLERFIFQMGLLDSKVHINGKRIAVVTSAVKKFCDQYQELKSYVCGRLGNQDE